MSLTELQIRNASQAEKPFKLADGRGLFLLVRPNGSKLFRFRYRHGGKPTKPASSSRKALIQGMRRRPKNASAWCKRRIHSRLWLASSSRTARRGGPTLTRVTPFAGFRTTYSRRSARALSTKSSLRNCSRLCENTKRDRTHHRREARRRPRQVSRHRTAQQFPRRGGLKQTTKQTRDSGVLLRS